jgi:HAE1 family hydrophobic/amphiphilic exporter-1
MHTLGYSLDNLSLMALTLAIGFLVDDAIVFLENVVRRMEHFDEGPLTASLNGAKEIGFTILSMTLSLAAVFVPLLFMGGLIGRIFREFAVTIVVAILASGVVSLTLTPLMTARMLGRRGKGAKETWMQRAFGHIERRVLGAYGRSLWFFLRHRWVSLVIWVICLGGTLYLFYAVPKSFLPIGDSSFIRGVLIAQEGTSPQRMHQLQQQTEEGLHANPAVKMTFTASGISRFLSSNQAFILAFLSDPGERPAVPVMGPNGKLSQVEDPDIVTVAQSLMMQVGMRVQGAFPALQPNPVLQISTGAAATQTGQFSYSISGIDPQEVYDAAQKLTARLQQEQGTIFMPPIISDLYLHTPNLRVDILREKAAMYRVAPARIETLLRNAYSQNYVYLIKKSQDQYQVILETTDQARRLPEDLEKLYIRSDDGRDLVPLSAVATWEPTLGPQAVNHLNQFTSVTLNFNLMPGVPIGDATTFIEDVASQILPAHIKGQFQGEALTFRETLGSMTWLMILAVFVMYVILAVLYESYVHPVTVLSTLPTALVGGLLTLMLFGEEASLYAFIGLFMLMGIVKKNGIMIVDFAIQRVAAGESAAQSIHDASMDRFRPILMTTLAAVMGAVPIAMGWGSSGEERRPLGLVIVGGLLVSQLITLYITPVLYLYMELFQEKVLNRIPFFASHYEGHAVAAALERRPHEDDEFGHRVPALAGATGNGNGNDAGY